MRQEKTQNAGLALEKRIAASRDRLYRVALAWCGDAALADDLVQETIEVGISKQKQLRDPDRFYAWLYSILNNQWRKCLRKHRMHEQLPENLPSNDPNPMNKAEEHELVFRVRRAVAGLPVKERQVLILVDLEELSYSDVARIIDIPIGTVMSRLHRARKQLLDRFENAGPAASEESRHLHLVS